jgi:protein phosphatase PTC2/3
MNSLLLPAMVCLPFNTIEIMSTKPGLGIWDCLNSQQVVDFVRYEVSQGKELSEIGEMICDHCIAPDTSTGAGIGCDNMTILIAAILHGRTKEEWYSWITDRVNKKYGYDTPTSHPQLYAPSRVAAFRARQQMQRDRDNNRGQDMDDNSATSFLTASGLGGFARVLGSTGGISFHPGGGIIADNGSLMFGTDDSDEEDEEVEAEEINGRPFFSPALGLGQSSDDDDGTDAAKSLKARLAEFEKDLQDEELDDVDSDTSDTDLAAADLDMKLKAGGQSTTPPSTQASSSLQGEAPPPPSATSTRTNGDIHTQSPVAPVEQLKSPPGGDKASPAVQADGLMDTSEDPIVTSA